MSPHVWVAALTVAILRGLPFITLRASTPPEGRTFLPIAFVPQDWLAYAAMVRQAMAHPLELLKNPFTTEAHDGRFLLLYHQLVGGLCRLFGLDPFWALEVSRVPLLLLFFYLLWRLLGRIYSEERHRIVAVWLVALSGGLSFIAKLGLDFLPKEVSDVGHYDFWAMHGWSSFEAFYNPLWLAGLCLVLPILGATLDPRRKITPRGAGLLALLFFALYFVHPYSAIVVLAVVLLHPVLRWVFGAADGEQSALSRSLPVILGLLLAGAVSLWQLRDPVYRASSASLWGTRQLPVFWYPITYGALLYFVLRGWQSWLREGHPWRFALGAWTLAVIALHTSPLLNGYHFVYFLHLPLVIVAAPSLAALFARLRQRRLGRWAGALLALLLFAAPWVVTVQALGDTLRDSKVSTETFTLIQRLAQQAPGRVLAPSKVAQLVPAFSPHHVYAGHWFMTPNYEQRKNELQKLYATVPLDIAQLRRLIDREQIDYVVLPAAVANEALEGLALPADREIRVGARSLLLLAKRVAP